METKEFNRKMSGANNGFLHLFINLLLLAAIVFGTMGLVKVAGDGAAISFCILMCFVYILQKQRQKSPESGIRADPGLFCLMILYRTDLLLTPLSLRRASFHFRFS